MALGCGGDETPPRRAVFWLALATARGATCSTTESYELPEMTARQTITSMTGKVSDDDRIVDSRQTSIDCTVKPVAGAAGSFDVDLSLSTDGEIAYFSANGVVSEASTNLEVSLQTGAFALEQSGCTANLETGIPGAVWLKDLSCPDLRDDNSPSIACVGSGGFIFENCGR